MLLCLFTIMGEIVQANIKSQAELILKQRDCSYKNTLNINIYLISQISILFFITKLNLNSYNYTFQVNISRGPVQYNYPIHYMSLHFGMTDDFGSEHAIDGHHFAGEVSALSNFQVIQFEFVFCLVWVRSLVKYLDHPASVALSLKP